MHKRKLPSLLARAVGIGAAGLTASLLVGAGAASAGIPADPPIGVAPLFLNGNVEQIRGSGSDTTVFMMQKISDLFTGAGLYGCTLNANNATNYNPADPAPSTANEFFFCAANKNAATTDVSDNWDRTEVVQGIDDVGSGAGQGQLCGSIDTPIPVDFARSSKPAGSIAGCNMVETGYAKDGVPAVDYPINPSTFGTSTIAPYNAINGGSVGPVASGWLPGDSVTGTTFSGTKLNNISNNDGGGGAGSTAYRLWCATDTTRITDWGQLTNIGPSLRMSVATTSGQNTITWSGGNFPSTIVAGDVVSGASSPFASGTTVSSGSGTPTLTLSNPASSTGTFAVNFATGSTKLAVGSGVPIGIPVRLMGVNPASGTTSTMSSFAESGVSGGGCATNLDGQAANDPNPATAPSPNAAHIALENNSDQIDQFAAADFPSPDFADQAIEVATTLYFESNGVFNTNPFAAASTINGTTFSASKLLENGVSTTTPNLLNNIYPTARTLFNIYNSNVVRASTGGFLNWICDGNTNFPKSEDNSTGLNFDTELNTLIGTTFGFPRLTDESSPATTAQPADNQPAPNTTCAASLPVNTTSGSNTITLASGNFPTDIVGTGGLVGGTSVGVLNADFPAGTTVVSGGGTNTLTLSNNATATGTAVPTTFQGVPSITAVASPNT
jgi:hypothetical protein